MKKTLILLFTLVIALSLVFVSCDNSIASQDKNTEATAIEFDKSVAESVHARNAEAVSVIEDSTSDLSGMTVNPSSLAVGVSIKAKEGETFSLISEEDYKEWFLTKIPADMVSRVSSTPNKYDYIRMSFNLDASKFKSGQSDISEVLSSFKMKLSYKTKDSEAKEITDLYNFVESEDQLFLDFFACFCKNGESNPQVDLDALYTAISEIASTSPTVKFVFSISDGKNSYTFSLDDVMSVKKNNLTVKDVIEMKRNNELIASLKYTLGITFSSDFDFLIVMDNLDSMIDKMTGSVNISVSNIELKIGDNVVISGSISGKLDFDKKEANADFSLTERIDGKEYVVLDFGIAGEASSENSELLDLITIKKVKIDGVYYTPESVKAYLADVNQNK